VCLDDVELRPTSICTELRSHFCVSISTLYECLAARTVSSRSVKCGNGGYRFDWVRCSDNQDETLLTTHFCFPRSLQRVGR
jgi:hypothetical protein